MPDADSRIRAHYDSHALTGSVFTALVDAGLDPAHLTITDLAPVDQFHSGGIAASRELARLAGIRRGASILDLGGGIGGPARLLAAELGCDVTVLDLTPSFCATGERLTEATGLADRVRFIAGSAVAPPFTEGAFDVCWTQHSTMNIADKAALYRAAHRMLRRGGLLAMHEITAGASGRPRYPVPWASEEALSYLVPPDELREIIAQAGFRTRAWRDVTDDTIAWLDQRLRAAAARPSPRGPHLLAARQAGPRFQNLLGNLEENRVRVVMAVFERAG